MEENVTNTIQSKYAKYSQSYDDGTRFLPKAAKIALFWEMYPNGTIITPLPVKDITGEGIVATCQVYRDSSDKENSLLADTYARRSTATMEDAEEGTIELYAAAQADAVSKALALAGVNISIDEIYKDILSVTPKDKKATVPEELVIENGAPVEEPIPAPEDNVVISEPSPTDNTTDDVATPDTKPSEDSSSENVPQETEKVADSSVEPSETIPSTEEVINETVEAPNAENTEESLIEENGVPEPEEASIPVETDIPDPNINEDIPHKEEKKTKTTRKKTTKVEEPTTPETITEPEPVVEETPVVSEEEPPAINKDAETEESLKKELGITYEDALEVPFRHQTREGKLGDLLNDNTSKCLLKWMGNPEATFRKKNTRQSKIAQIIVLHNSLS